MSLPTDLGVASEGRADADGGAVIQLIRTQSQCFLSVAA